MTAPAQGGGRRRWIALVVLCLGQLMIVLDATIVNVAVTILRPVRAPEPSQPTTEELQIREGLLADEMV